jgi:beta-xylosidase
VLLASSILSDHTNDSLGTRLSIFNPDPSYLDQVQIGSGELVIKGRGKTPADGMVFSFISEDYSYETQVEVELKEGAQAGLLLFYSPRFYCGIGFNARRGYSYLNGSEAISGFGSAFVGIGTHFYLKVVNNENVASFYFSVDGQTWTLHSSADVSGYNHNISGGFVSLRPALYVAGEGEARFRKLRYSGKNNNPGPHA